MRTRYQFVPEAFKGVDALENAWIVGIEPKFRRQKLETKQKICQDLNIIESCDAILRVANEKIDGISVATVNDLGIATAGVVRAMGTVADSTLDGIKKMLSNCGTNILDPLQAPEPRNEEAIQESVVLGAVGSDFGSLHLGNVDVPVSVELEDIHDEDVDVDEILSVYNQERNSESASITLEDVTVQEWWNNPGRIDPGIFNNESQELPSMDIEDLDVMYDRVSWSLGHQINTPPRNINYNDEISSDVGMEFGAVGAAEFNQNDVGTIERGRNADFASVNEEPIEEGRIAEIPSISEERTIERGRDVQAAVNELDSRGQLIDFHVSSEVDDFENQSVEHAGTIDELPRVPSIHVPEASQSIVPEAANNPRRRRRKRLIIDQVRRIELDRNFDYSGPGEHKPFDCIIPQELKFAARSNNLLNRCGRAMPSLRLQKFYTETMRFASLRKNLVSLSEPVLRNALDEMRDTPPVFEPCHQENGHRSLPRGSDVTMTDGDDRIEAQDAAGEARQTHVQNDNSTLDNIEMGDEIISFVTSDDRNYDDQPRGDPDATIQAIPLSLEETLRIENDPANTCNPQVEDPSATSDSDLDVVRNGTAKRVKRPRNASTSKIRRITTGATSGMPSPNPNSSDDEDRNMRVHHTLIHFSQVDQSPGQILPDVLEDANLPNSQPNQSLPPPDHRDDAASDIGSSTSGNSSTFLFVPRIHISESILSDGASMGSLFTDIFPPATTPRIVAAKAFLQILYMYGTKLLLEQKVSDDTQDVTIYPIRLCLLSPPDMELNSEESN